MKKNLSWFAGLGIVALSLVSCKKEECSMCHYDDANGNEVEIGEYCDDDRASLEANGYTVNGTTFPAHCGAH
jgi:uncharacterized lipoprotein YehR (DUF1307 family)